MPDIIKEIFLKFITVSLIASALILIIQLISPLLKKRFSARWRYWAWLLLALWLLVPVTFTVSQAPVQISVTDTAIVQPPAEITPIVAEPQTGNAATGNTNTVQQTTPSESAAQDNASSVAEAETPGFLAAVSAFLSRYTILDLIIAVWAAGAVIVLFCRWIAALRFRSKLRRRWRPCDSPAVVRSIRGAMEGMGFHEEIDIKFCKEVKSPFMTGLFRPVLVLPEQDFDPYLLAHIVRHEITHYRRRDLWYKAVINFATTLHWFNPFIRVMNRASDLDLELVCDEIVTQNHDLDNRKAYGESILLTVKPGLDRRPAALTTSFSRGAKNLKERFESIMLMKAKNSGIVFLALVMMIAILASCGTGLNINKFDWTLYTNTEWRCEDADADLYFKDKAKGIVFDLYISQICIVENVETTGKLKTSADGFIDTFSGDYDGTSVKASITFSPDGDYVIVTITEAGGVAANLGEYRFVKADSDSVQDMYGTFRKFESWPESRTELKLTLNPDGSAAMFYGTQEIIEDTVGTFIITGDQVIYTRNIATSSDMLGFEHLPETTSFKIIDKDTLEVEGDYSIVMGNHFTDHAIFLSRINLSDDDPIEMNLYDRFLAVELGMTLEQVESSFGEKLTYGGGNEPEQKYTYTNDYLWLLGDASAVFTFSNGKLVEKLQYRLFRVVEDFIRSDDYKVSKDVYESIQLGISYDEVAIIIGNKGGLEREVYTKDLIVKDYNWFVDGGPQVIFVFENDILTQKYYGGQR